MTASTSGLRSWLVVPVSTRRLPTAKSSSCRPHCRRPPAVALLVLSNLGIDPHTATEVEHRTFSSPKMLSWMSTS
eukprot:9674186-Heterocapsa_arctica.AAC.1